MTQDRHVIYDRFKNTYFFHKESTKLVLAPLKCTLSLESKKKVSSLLVCKAENEINRDYNVKSLVDENAQGKLSERIVLGKSIVIEKLASLDALEIEKCNFQELNYVVNFESRFGKQICDLRSYMSWVEFETSLMFFLLLMGRKTLVLFFFYNPCVDVTLGSFQQWESYINLGHVFFNKDNLTRMCLYF